MYQKDNDYPIAFDGHNDALLKLWLARDHEPVKLFSEGYQGAVDVPKAKSGGFGGGLFAMFSPSDSAMEATGMGGDSYDLPLPPKLSRTDAIIPVLEQAAIFLRLDNACAIRHCTSVSEVEMALGRGQIAAVLHLEGADCIDSEFLMLDVLYAIGLRSLGPVWSRPNMFGHGVPFRFPSTGDTGPGLTDLGKELVRECNSRGIMVDVSHMTEAGFCDVAAISDAPLIASHSNAHAIVPHARNLTDRQLDMLRDSNGLVGINFATAFLRQDGQMVETDNLDALLWQIDYLIEKLGENHVGLGSDFDGAQTPLPLSDVSGLSNLRHHMIDAGYGEEIVRKVFCDNWLSVLKRTWC